jgi:hypothetical protein
VDRISEQALRAKKVSKLNAQPLDIVGDSSDANAAGAQTPAARRSSAARNQRPLLQIPESRMASIARLMSQFGRTRAFQLIFKFGLAVVALCFLAELISVVTAAATQAKCVT